MERAKEVRKVNKKEYENIRMMQELYFKRLCQEAEIDHISLEDL